MHTERRGVGSVTFSDVMQYLKVIDRAPPTPLRATSARCASRGGVVHGEQRTTSHRARRGRPSLARTYSVLTPIGVGPIEV